MLWTLIYIFAVVPTLGAIACWRFGYVTCYNPWAERHDCLKHMLYLLIRHFPISLMPSQSLSLFRVVRRWSNFLHKYVLVSPILFLKAAVLGVYHKHHQMQTWQANIHSSVKRLLRNHKSISYIVVASSRWAWRGVERYSDSTKYSTGQN